MKKISILVLTVLLASCNANEAVEKVSDDSLTINAYIGNKPVTRVSEKDDWQENDALGVFVCNGTIDQPYLGNTERYVNVPFRHNGKGFVAGNIYLDENLAEVFAYFPYSAVATTGSAVPVESSTQTDYLYGHAETPASITQKNVNMEMKHALSQIVFRIRLSTKYDEGQGSLSMLKIENNDAQNVFKTSGTLDLSSGLITGTSNMGVLTLMPGKTLLLTTEYQTISSICLPIGPTTGKNIKAVFNIDERQFHFEFPVGTSWNAGYRNIYTLTVENSGLIIGGGEDGADDGITIEPWNSSADSDISLVPIL